MENPNRISDRLKTYDPTIRIKKKCIACFTRKTYLGFNSTRYCDNCELPNPI